MKLGMVVRNWGETSRRETLLACAGAAEAAGIDSLWLTEQIGVPAPGLRDPRSDAARALDPLALLPFLAQATRRIHLGVAVLVAAFHHPLRLARFAATVQDLSRGRLELGLGLGFHPKEFRAMGVPVPERGAALDEALRTFRRSFDEDVIDANGQSVVCNPRPQPPPLLVGGNPDEAFDRVLDHGDGWIVTGMNLQSLTPAIARLRQLAAGEDRKPPQVTCVQTLPVMEPMQAADVAAAYAAAGVDQLVHASSYAAADEFKAIAAVLAEKVRPSLT